MTRQAAPSRKRDRGTDGRQTTSRKHGNRYTSAAEKEILYRRRHHVEGGTVVYVGEDSEPIGTAGKMRRRYAIIGAHTSIRTLCHSPADGIAKAIRDALDPVKAPSKGRTLADMTEAEIKALEQQYGAPIIRP